MRIPNPYFKNVPNIGDLIMDYILLEYDYPVLFVCKTQSNKLYLCDCCDVFAEQRWLIAPTTIEKLQYMLKNQLTIREMFESAEGECCVATWSTGDSKEKYQLINSNEFLEEDLPEKDVFIDADEGEYDSYLSLLKTRNIYQAQLDFEGSKSILESKNAIVDTGSITSKICHDEILINSVRMNYSKFNTSSGGNMNSVVVNKQMYLKNMQNVDTHISILAT